MPSWINWAHDTNLSMTATMTFTRVCQCRICDGRKEKKLRKKKNEGGEKQKANLTSLRGCPATPSQT